MRAIKAPNRNPGSSSGQSLVELAVGLIVLLPILLVIFDLVILVVAVMLNDNACRDAARAAAAGRPIAYNAFPADSYTRAAAVVSRVYQSGGYITGPTLVPAAGEDGTNTGPSANVKAPDPTFGGGYIGTYRVTTQVVVKLPASIPGLTPDTIPLQSRQEFPLTKQEANSAAPN